MSVIVEVGDLRNLLQTLSAQREILEIEADALHSELTSPTIDNGPPAGLNSQDAPLIDDEGFPRGDIDIYDVINKRRRLKEISNDHKALMKRIEAVVAELFQSQSNINMNSAIIQQTINSSLPQIVSTSQPISKRIIAKIDEILEGSPAYSAGLKNGDELYSFGHIDNLEGNMLQQIPKLVGDSVGKPIPLSIRRDGEAMQIDIIPCTWSGRGLLGCRLLPIVHQR
eukprot:gene4253-6032_t